MAFDLSLYNDEFFEWHQRYAHQYSIDTMNWLVDTFQPHSVVDFGCGIGSYLYAAYYKGVKRLKGYDIGGVHAKKYTAPEIQPFIEYLDLTKHIRDLRMHMAWEMILCFETAEHIEPSGTRVFLDNIACFANYKAKIFFTAAPPGQEGTGHINCQPRQFWIEEFQARDFEYNADLTKQVADKWKELGAPDYIVNNLIIIQ